MGECNVEHRGAKHTGKRATRSRRDRNTDERASWSAGGEKHTRETAGKYMHLHGALMQKIVEAE
mgnify:CR=1 FL=1